MSGPAWFFAIGGLVAAVWGVTVAVFNRWAQRIGGDELMNGKPLTPGFVRVIGIGLAIGGTVMATAAFSGLLREG
ncbi:hypothetical protein ACRQ4C_15085 [Curtobacterium sp. SP.BCp]|uniref:hypothetical protein n=1 Tax=Curtobacterium sp. SP.BCp TaxID=3435230 RepID=UPI003F73F92A